MYVVCTGVARCRHGTSKIVCGINNKILIIILEAGAGDRSGKSASAMLSGVFVLLFLVSCRAANDTIASSSLSATVPASLPSKPPLTTTSAVEPQLLAENMTQPGEESMQRALAVNSSTALKRGNTTTLAVNATSHKTKPSKASKGSGGSGKSDGGNKTESGGGAKSDGGKKSEGGGGAKSEGGKKAENASGSKSEGGKNAESSGTKADGKVAEASKPEKKVKAPRPSPLPVRHQESNRKPASCGRASAL